MNNIIKHQHEFTVNDLATFDRVVIFAYVNEEVIEIDGNRELLFKMQSLSLMYYVNTAASAMINKIFLGV